MPGVKNVLILRLKQAESAMADGRLDEAFDIVQSKDIREHRRGQKLIGRLALAFTKRGLANLEAERIQLALGDCNKAEKLAGNTADVAKLRSAICSEMEQRRLRSQHRSLKVAQARQHIQDGWISAGEEILKDAGDDGQADIVLQQAAVARLHANEAVTKAEKALQRNDLDAAIDLVRNAGAVNSQNEQVIELVHKLRLLAVRQIKENFNSGRLDLAQSLWQKVSPIADGCSEISELGSALSQCSKAAEYVAAGRIREAVNLLRKVQLTCPAAQWLGTVTNQSRQAAELLDELAASPLGLDMTKREDMEDEIQQTDDKGRSVSETHRGHLTHERGRDALDTSGRPRHESLLSKFVLQIDGVGSFYVLRDSRITVGPVSSSAQPTVGLMVDPNMPTVTIERSEDDYFIRSSSPVRVNDVATTNKLLVDSDRINLSPRCGMKFNIPNPASTTATLSLPGTRLGRADVRKIILMDRDILIGSTEGSHIIAESIDETIALFTQNGRLLCRAKGKILVDDKTVSPTAGLPFNKQIRIGQISLVLTELKE
jgi:tetratricopeptide (TPR) repeat protein